MKERGLIFSGPMVRANLEGQKTQTRRVIIPQPKNYLFWSDGFQKWFDNKAQDTYDMVGRKCPWGVVGDKFYIRECYGIVSKKNPLIRATLPIFEYTRYHRTKPDCLQSGYEMLYRATQNIDPDFPIYWRSGRFMPKWVARPERFEITDIRVERVRDISEEDAISEGIQKFEYGTQYDADYGGREQNMAYSVGYGTVRLALSVMESAAKNGFRRLWDSINAKPKPLTKNSKLARILLGNEALNRIAGNIACYVSYPWDNIRETREYKGKLWYVYGNPRVFSISYRKL